MISEVSTTTLSPYDDYQGIKLLDAIFGTDVTWIVVVVNNLVICNVLSVFGTAVNIVNMMIFYRQGLDNSINISLFGIAISDILSLVTQLWYNVCMNPLFYQANLSIDPADIQHLTACYPHDCFARITCLITLYITVERCLCIVVPLKVKQILTPKRTVVIVCLCFLLMISLLVPEYAYLYIDWKFFPEVNRTLLGLVPRKQYSHMMGLTAILYATFLIGTFIAEIILTAILIYKLQSKEQWRMEVTSDQGQKENMSARNKKTITMVTLIAAVIIVCSTPIVAVYIWMFLDSEFTYTGRNAKIYYVMVSLAQVFEVLNASVNIFMYYTMSSKYRETFLEIFGSCSRKSAITS